jgi:hypothetical protein
MMHGLANPKLRETFEFLSAVNILPSEM